MEARPQAEAHGIGGDQKEDGGRGQQKKNGDAALHACLERERLLKKRGRAGGHMIRRAQLVYGL